MCTFVEMWTAHMETSSRRRRSNIRNFPIKIFYLKHPRHSTTRKSDFSMTLTIESRWWSKCVWRRRQEKSCKRWRHEWALQIQWEFVCTSLAWAGKKVGKRRNTKWSIRFPNILFDEERETRFCRATSKFSNCIKAHSIQKYSEIAL